MRLHPYAVTLIGGPAVVLLAVCDLNAGVAARPQTAAVASAAARLTATGRWHVEHDAPSDASLVIGPGGIELRFALTAGRPTNQFAAAVVAVPDGLDRFVRLVVRARADRPMRIAIQLRNRDGLGASRWRRTMYLDNEMRTAAFDLRGFVPVAPERAPAPPLATIAVIMLGVDTVNTRPATRARILFDDVRLER